MKILSQLESILKDAESNGRNTLLEDEAYRFLELLEIPTPKTYLIQDIDHIDSYIDNQEIKTDKVVLKIISPDIFHKSDVGGVLLVDNKKDAIISGYNSIISNITKYAPNAKIEGIIICEKVNIQHELLVSIMRDAQMGYILSTGFGGIYIEIFKDFIMQLIPTEKEYIEKNIQNLKSFKLLQGYRNTPPTDIPMFIDMLMKISKVAEVFSEESDSEYLIDELEINPFVSTKENSFYALDCIVRFHKKTESEKLIYSEQKINIENIEYLIDPKSIALVGATDEAGKLGQLVMTNLMDGEIKNLIPINPKSAEISGIKAYKTVEEVPENVDMAILVIASKFCEDVIKQCINKKVKVIVIVSGGFGELTEDGKKAEVNIKNMIKTTSTRIIGPNCLGVYTSRGAIYTYGIPKTVFMFPTVQKHNVTLLTQSGALSVFLSEMMPNVGFRAIISYGNMLDVDMGDFITFFNKDTKTDVIAIYAEGMKNGRKFFKAAKSATKPILMLKGGKTEEGTKATLSHTGSMTQNHAIVQTAINQAGIVECKTFEEFKDAMTIFSFLRHKEIRGNRVAILSNAGGMGVLAADAVPAAGLQLSQYDPLIAKKIEEYAGGLNKIGNPADMGVGVDDIALVNSLEELLKDENVDGVLFCPGIEPISLNVPRLFTNLIRTHKRSKKPFIVSFPENIRDESLINVMEKNLIAYFPTPERAINSFGMYIKYCLNKMK